MPDQSKSICLAGAEGMMNQEETPNTGQTPPKVSEYGKMKRSN